MDTKVKTAGTLILRPKVLKGERPIMFIPYETFERVGEDFPHCM